MTTTPESALAEVMALSEKAAKGPWVISSHGTIESRDRHIASVQSGGYVDTYTADLIIMAVDFIRIHGAHFAALAEQVAEQDAEIGRLKRECELRKHAVDRGEFV